MEYAKVRPVLTVPDPAAAVDWLENNLFFQPTPQPDIIRNGTCELLLRCGVPNENMTVSSGHYPTGPEHIALRTADIEAAKAYCQARDICLNLLDGHPYYNPNVYGQGEYYFNFVTPFGQLIEISQRVAEPHYGETDIIEGLDHIGLPSRDLYIQLTELGRQGFAPEFEPVHNYNDKEGNIYCCMVKRDDIVLEVYQFADMCGTDIPASQILTLPGIVL